MCYIEKGKSGVHSGESFNWEISWHFVAYCSGCGFEPDVGHEFPAVCPQCGAAMLNADDFNHPIRRRAGVGV